jgi:glc operon protein GlcG
MLELYHRFTSEKFSGKASLLADSQGHRGDARCTLEDVSVSFHPHHHPLTGMSENTGLELRKERKDMAALTLEMAEKAVKAAQAKARDQGTPMTVTVVDEAGRLVLSARGDGAGFFTPETSRAKAVAAAAFRRPTKEMVRLRDSSPAFWSNISNVLAGEALPSIGAVPVLSGGKVIGAVGCGGGSGEQDHLCAEAGAAAIANG